MTLHISAVLGDTAYQVSDRLVTRQGDVWERTFNKNIVLRTADALVSMGFCQRAFIDSTPIDEWAAQVIWGSQIDDDTVLSEVHLPGKRFGLSAALARLLSALNRNFSQRLIAPISARVHVVIVGFRFGRRGLRPCLLVMSNLDSGRLVTVRPKLRRRPRFSVVMNDPPGWIPVDRFQRFNQALSHASHEQREDLMIELIRELSRSGAPIGPDAMCIRIPWHVPKPTIRFEPAEALHQVFHRKGVPNSEIQLPVAYTPIIITPNVIQLPSLTTGLAWDHMAGFEIEWRLPPLSKTVLLADRQARRRPGHQ